MAQYLSPFLKRLLNESTLAFSCTLLTLLSVPVILTDSLLLPAPKQDDNKPKKTPPPATPVRLPSYVPKEPTRTDLPEGSELARTFAGIRGYPNIKPYHAELLNLKVERDVPLEQLVPASYLLGVERNEVPSTTATTNTADVRSSKRLSNGTAVPGQEAYLVRKRELEVANEVAYETVKRRGAKTEVKIVQYRKFFETLELVGTYWDTSRDDVGMTGEEESKTDLRDSNKMDIDTVGAVEQAPDESKGDDRKTVYQAGKSDQDTNNTTTNTLKHAGEKHTDHEFSGERQDGDETAAPQTSKPTQEGNNSTKTTEDTYTYTGHRLSTGSQMPESYRLDLIRTFIEPLLWSFGLLAEPPRSQPRLQIQNLLIPVRHSAVIYRTPLWRARARAGCLEGPVMGVHCREDIVSRGDNECLGRMVRELFKRQRLTEKQYDEKVKRLVRETSSEVADLLREVGAMLLLGQERAREDQEEEFPGEGKWWVERPRWGGHKQEKESKEEKKKEEEGDGLDKSEAEGEALKEKRRRERMMEKWCEMQGPSSRWEKKVTYMHVGKIKEQEYDDIYLLSSIAHHISILHLRVHSRYLQNLTRGSPNPDLHMDISEEEPWYILHLKRSKWYDLFIPEERVEAMKGIWTVCRWMMRDLDE